MPAAPSGTDDGWPAGDLCAEAALPSGVGAPGAARGAVHDCLSGRVSPQLLEDVQLLVSELVTNSLDHARRPDGEQVLLRVHLAASTLHVEVENQGTAGVIAQRTPDVEGRPGGFGLHLVDVLATRWGTDRGLDTSVWFEMARA